MRGINGQKLENVVAFLMQNGVSPKRIEPLEEETPEGYPPMPPGTVWRHEPEDIHPSSTVELYHTPKAAPAPASDIEALKAEIFEEVDRRIDAKVSDALSTESLMETFVRLAAAHSDESDQPEPPAPPTTSRPFWLTDEDEQPAPPARPAPQRRDFEVDVAIVMPDFVTGTRAWTQEQIRQRLLDEYNLPESRLMFFNNPAPNHVTGEPTSQEPAAGTMIGKQHVWIGIQPTMPTQVIEVPQPQRPTRNLFGTTGEPSIPYLDPQTLVEGPWDDDAKRRLRNAGIAFDEHEQARKNGPDTPTVVSVQSTGLNRVRVTWVRKTKKLEKEKG